MAFTFHKLNVQDAVLVEPKVFEDSRGFFCGVIYKASEFKQAGIDIDFIQVNNSVSKKNVLRGLHYQLNPKGQAKLIRVFQGEILDVLVDIRKNSPTYGKWVGEKLSRG